ncbi:MAG: hypothetical protein BWY95_02223 [Bacteroidetes bacterium ADurb.BinA104]|nr:MAG: hypothetical protein BWY95_02223 [Bacteroidetes bacterium ADurb.BinA104]
MWLRLANPDKADVEAIQSSASTFDFVNSEVYNSGGVGESSIIISMLSQSEKTCFPILAPPSNLIVESELQPLKAKSPTYSTLAGIVSETIPSSELSCQK